ncbi:MAG: hypothetical protein CVU05_00975 [Bacteroidetes bacterium HGW-Bacteroidetes-21]|nr:MAG: hypothetical protein CVU05_00975 [Bacteroidetes bacterium HGW-Bacteroidetes-21]
MEFRKHPKRVVRHFLGAPIIYSIVIPVVLLDLWVEIYHRSCFPIYGLPYVKRRSYIKIDRQKLKYLSFTEKVNCMYCGYMNGFLHYAVVIAGETEKYWCGIKHKAEKDFHAPPHHDTFMEYGDQEAYLQVVPEKSKNAPQ